MECVIYSRAENGCVMRVFILEQKIGLAGAFFLEQKGGVLRGFFWSRKFAAAVLFAAEILFSQFFRQVERLICAVAVKGNFF